MFGADLPLRQSPSVFACTHLVIPQTKPRASLDTPYVPGNQDQLSSVVLLAAVKDHGRNWAEHLLYDFSMSVVSAAVDREIAAGTLTANLTVTLQGLAVLARFSAE
jgi:hypothetical protein